MRLFLPLPFLLSVSPLSAWSPTDHMVIGEIAKERPMKVQSVECRMVNAVIGSWRY